MKNENNTLSIGLLIALVGFPQISETIYTPALPGVASSLSASIHLVEATLAIYFAGFALGVALWGSISDLCGRKMAMLAGLIIYGIGTFGCGSSTSIEALLAWRFVQAFGASVGSVITQTILRDAYTGAERTKLFSILSGALAFSPALGPIIGGIISEFLGWRTNFWALTAMGVCLYIWALKKLPETRSLSSTVPPTLSQMGNLAITMSKSSVLWGHIMLIGATNGILFGFYQEAPFIYIEQLGMKPSIYGLFGLLIAAATIIAARFSYRYSKSFSSETMINWGAISVMFGALIFTNMASFNLFALNLVGIGVSVVALFFVFFGIGLIIPNSLSTALKQYQYAAGTAGSIFGGIYYCMIAVCTWLLSFLHNGTQWPLPLYILGLGIVLLCGSQMIRAKSNINVHSCT